MIHAQRIHRWLARVTPVLALAALWLVAGCSTSKPEKLGSRRLAAVVVTNQSPERIEAAVKWVFIRAGYDKGDTDAELLVYERRSNFMNSLVYGDWLTGAVWERVKIHQRDLDDTEVLLDCDVFMVQEHDDPFFQKEIRVNKHASDYQEMLEQVVVRLGQKWNIKDKDAEPVPPPKKATKEPQERTIEEK